MNTRRIERLEIEGLFGRFNYTINLGAEKGGLKILTAPNGYGKSTIIKIIDSFAHGKYDYFIQEKFKKIKFDLSESVSVDVVKNGGDVSIESDGKKVSLKRNINNRSRRVMSRRTPPYLRRIDSYLWRDERTEEVLDERDVLLRYADFFQDVEVPKNEEWLDEIRKSLSVLSISTNRLKSDSGWESRRLAERGMGSLRVDEIAEHIKNSIQKEIRRQFEKGRQLEASFPARLIEALSSSSGSTTVKSVKDAMDSVQEKEARFVGLGLAPETGSAGKIPSFVADSLKGAGVIVLRTYLDDILNKFKLLDGLAGRLEVFCRSINELLSFKSISTSADKGIVVRVSEKENEEVPLEFLSSGEQHLIVLVGELLFKAKENSLVLIDEPEISFHPEWQERFLGVLEDIQKVNAFSVLVSTHSPMLIGDRWDSVIELALQYGDARE